tara:strand:+ start:4259 stop:5227 length:969 start_codon:yes stop_codon:yes gene_type:complete
MGLLSACSPDGILRLTKTESSAHNSTQKSDKTANNQGIGAPVALPPRFDSDQPPLPGQQPRSLMLPNGLPALQPKGINVDTLFAQKLRDSDERFDRVENAIVDFRKEFEVYKPAIVRLAAVESDIQDLIKELEVVLQETPAQQPPIDLSGRPEPTLDVKQLNPHPSPPPEMKDVPSLRPPDAKVASKPLVPPPKSAAKPHSETVKHAAMKFDGSVALNFRIGEQSDKVRVAFDTNQKTPFNIDIDNDEKLIVIELPKARWEGKKSMTFPDSKLFESMTVEDINDQGSMIVLTLKKQAQILQEKRLDPDKTTAYHRVYFDLKP